MIGCCQNGKVDMGTEAQNNEDKKKNSKALYQIFLSTGPLALTAGVGAMMGFSGIFLPQLEDPDSSIKIVSLDIDSWIASAAVVPMPFAALLGGYLMEKTGRRWAHILPAIPGVIGWIVIALAQDITAILIGRVLTGICNGTFAPVTSAFIGELTSPSLRPFVLGCIALNLALGTFLCQLIGTFYSWRITAWICLLFPAIGGILTFFAVETPNWYLRKNRVEEACASFTKIRGISEESNKELEVMLENHKNQSTDQKTVQQVAHDLVSKPEIYKPLITVVLYFVSAQFSGINVITFYAISIVEQSLGPGFDFKYLIMLTMAFIRMITGVLACVLLKKMKRRDVAIIGGSGCFICLIMSSVSNYFSSIYTDPIITTYIPLAGLLGFVFFLSISLVPLPWCLAGELLPLEVKGLAGGILCFTSFFAFFTAIKFAPFLFNYLGSAYAYLFFSISSLFGTVLLYFCLPETMNRTLDEIASSYRKEKREIKA